MAGLKIESSTQSGLAKGSGRGLGSSNRGNRQKASGGEITESGSNIIHTFKSTDTFKPWEALTCDVLVVAGGGAGAKQSPVVAGAAGSTNTGGGGGGKYSCGTSYAGGSGVVYVRYKFQ